MLLIVCIFLVEESLDFEEFHQDTFFLTVDSLSEFVKFGRLTNKHLMALVDVLLELIYILDFLKACVVLLNFTADKTHQTLNRT